MLQGVFGTLFALGVVAFAVLLRVLPNTSGVSREALEAKLARAPRRVVEYRCGCSRVSPRKPA